MLILSFKRKYAIPYKCTYIFIHEKLLKSYLITLRLKTRS